MTGASLPAGLGGARRSRCRGAAPRQPSLHRASAIARLAAAVNRGDADRALAVLADGHDDVGWRRSRRRLAGLARLAAVDGFGTYLDASTTVRPRRTVLGPRGLPHPVRAPSRPAGAERVNRQLEEALRRRLIRPRGAWYAGRPVMVTRNDYALRVFNGDVGIVLPDVDAPENVHLAFEATDDVRPARLPPHETVSP